MREVTSHENMEAVRGVYARWERGDFTASLPLFDADSTLVIDLSIPDGGTFVGSDGVRSYMSRFLDAWESLTTAAESFKGGVVVIGRFIGRGAASGADVQANFTQVITMQKDKVTQVKLFQSRADALEAAGLQE